MSYYPATWQKIQNNHSRRYSTTDKRIKLWCDITGINRNQLAQACSMYGHTYKVGFNSSLIYAYCKGKCQPKMDKLVVMSKVMGVSETWLLGYGPDKLTNFNGPRM